VNAEDAREDGGGQLGGEEQCRGAGLPGADAELAESLGEPEGADRAAGLAAGEQPGRGALVTDYRLAAAARDDLKDELGEGLGQHDRFATQAQSHLVVLVFDVVEVEAA